MNSFDYILPGCFTNTKVTPTTKMFYGKYLCRAKFTVKSALFLRTKYINDPEIDQFHCLQHWVQWNYRPKWKDYNEIRTTLNKLILVEKSLRNVKKRIEYDTISVFFNSIDELVQLFVEGSGFNIDDLNEITIPLKPSHVKLLQEKYIIHPTNAFTFKVSYAGGEYSKDEHQQLLDFFNGQSSNEFKINDALRYYLTRSRSYVSPGYFYTTKEEYLTLLYLIAPGFISKVEKIKQITF